MPPHSVDLRQLANFVLACQNPTIGETARELGISTSTLSASLHALEQSLELKLFHRQGAYLAPLPAAFWLFQVATSVLHTESMARAAAAAEALPRARVQLRLDLSFNIGRFSKAVSRTVEAMRLDAPDVAFEFVFRNVGGAGQSIDFDDLAETTVDIAYAAAVEPDAASGLVHADDWVTVRQSGVRVDPIGPGRPLLVLRMRQVLLDAISAHGEAHGFYRHLSFRDTRLAHLGDLLGAEPGACFVLPRSMLSERMGLGRRHVEPLDPPLVTPIVARISGRNHEAAGEFIARLREALRAPEANAVFEPVLTARQIRYFNRIEQSGGIAAAARTTRTSQPTISQQIKRMEEALGAPLLQRTWSGTRLTAAGERLAPFALRLEERIDRIARGSREVAAMTQESVGLGLPPSSGHDSEMTARVARALIEVRARFPGCRLRVVHHSNAALHDAIKARELNLAVVGAALGPFPRVQLGPSEMLSIVAHPGLGLAGRETITLAEAVALPLALGPRQFSIHAAFARAAAEARLAVNTVVEIESLPLAIAMARLSPLATVLPSSSVRQDVDLGRLSASLIDAPLSSGTLSVIFSGDRVLSDIERAIVRALATAFAQSAAGDEA